MVELHPSRDEMKLRSLPPHYGLIRSEKMAGHTACMKYLKNSNGRYVLLDQLPEIGEFSAGKSFPLYSFFHSLHAVQFS